jgi:glycosyltransferase involved in cell wall biosynthesis
MNRIRLFQVITRMVLGGAQRVVLGLLERLPREEFEQTLVCGTGSASDAALLPRARETAAAVVLVPELVREVRPWRDTQATAKLAALFERRRPHVVHAHTYKAGVTACVAARLAGVPAVVFTPHGHIFARGSCIPGVPQGGWKLALLRWVTRGAQACAHRVTALSEADLREQLDLGLSPPSKYRVIRNGIDVDRYTGAPPRTAGDAPVIGAVGRFTAEKGHATLVEAFARVRGRLPRARLVLVGSGDLDQDLRGLARRLGVDGAVTFAGERDSAEVLPSFDLFVQPSLYESQGLAILEAMAAGRPVVATDVGGVRDAVRDGETGLLVPAADPGAMAGAILRLAGDPGEASAMAERARARIRELYSVDRMVAEYARLYKELQCRYNPGRCTTT